MMSLLNERWHVGNVQRVNCAFLQAFRDSADCFKASKHESSATMPATIGPKSDISTVLTLLYELLEEWRAGSFTVCQHVNVTLHSIPVDYVDCQNQGSCLDTDLGTLGSCTSQTHAPNTEGV